MKLFAQTYGASGPVVVILHGLFGMSDNWHSIARRLEADCRLLVPDLRNHGRSPAAAVMDYPSMAADVIELLDDQGIDRAVIVGHSMGGKVAMQCALTHPDRMDGVVVVDVAMRRYEPKHEHIFRAFEGLALDEVVDRKTAEGMLMRMLNDASTVQFLLKNIVRNDDGHYAWRIDHRLIRGNYDNINRAVKGGTFTGPSLLVRGARSTYVTDSDLADMRRHFPRLTTVDVPNAGHWVHADQPSIVTETLDRFILDRR